jgi:hypothetical protein
MKPRLTSGDLAEQHGYALAESALTAMQAAPDQADRGDILHTALLELQRLPHPRRSAGGFSVGLICTIERGLGVAK